MSDDRDPDDYLDPDEIIEPDDVRRSGVGSTVEAIAERAVDAVLGLVRRANALAGGVLMFVSVASIGGFLLGLAALDGGMQTVWIVLGGAFAVISIGSVITAMWRLRAVRHSADHLVSEVVGLIRGDRRSERIVVETVERNDAADDQTGVVELSRGFVDLNSVVSGRTDAAPHVASAISAVATFPGLLALATLIGAVFLFLGTLFLIALAL